MGIGFIEGNTRQMAIIAAKFFFVPCLFRQTIEDLYKKISSLFAGKDIREREHPVDRKRWKVRERERERADGWDGPVESR